MPFAAALSGLNAASSDLGVTANNVANVNTTGFKMSRAQFAEVFAVGTQSVSSSASGSWAANFFSRLFRFITSQANGMKTNMSEMIGANFTGKPQAVGPKKPTRAATTQAVRNWLTVKLTSAWANMSLRFRWLAIACSKAPAPRAWTTCRW